MNKASEALRLIKRSLGEHGWFTDEETDAIGDALKELDDVKHNYKAIKEMHSNSAAYAAKIQAELNELKKDVARYFELLLGTARHNQDTVKEYRDLREKLSKVEGEKENE